VARTRLTLDGYGGKRTGSFAGKSADGSGQTLPTVQLAAHDRTMEPAARERQMRVAARDRSFTFPAREKT
jgi:hypothetical protein